MPNKIAFLPSNSFFSNQIPQDLEDNSRHFLTIMWKTLLVQKACFVSLCKA